MTTVMIDPRILLSNEHLINVDNVKYRLIVPHNYRDLVASSVAKNPVANLSIGMLGIAVAAGHIEVARPATSLLERVPIDLDSIQLQVIATALAERESSPGNHFLLATNDRELVRVGRSKSLPVISSDDLSDLLHGRNTVEETFNDTNGSVTHSAPHRQMESTVSDTVQDPSLGDATNERAPETLGAAALRYVWKRPEKPRLAILLIIGALLTIFTAWTTLPDKAKERVLGLDSSAVVETNTAAPRHSASLKAAGQQPGDGSWPTSSEPEILEGWVDERHHPPADRDLIDLVLNNEGATVKLVLHLGPDLTSQFAKIRSTGARTYSFALEEHQDLIFMDLHLHVEDRTEFFFGAESPGTGLLRGTFRVLGCAQTGTGWVSCKLQAMPVS